MNTVRHDSIFGQQALPHTIIIARGDRVRHLTLRPWVLALSATVASAVLAGCVGLSAYLVMQDGLDASGAVRHERLQDDYEQRIASLRAQLDRAVSRQLLDRETVETKVDVLLDQQLALTERYEKLRPLLDRAKSNGLIPKEVPVPQPKPTSKEAAVETAPDATEPELALSFAPAAAGDGDRFALIEGGATGRLSEDAARWRFSSNAPATGAERSQNGAVSPHLIQEIGRSIDAVEERQIAGLFGLALSARSKAAGIASALRSEGIRLPIPAEDGAEGAAPSTEVGSSSGPGSGSGGPFVPYVADTVFETRFADLDTALGELQSVRRAALRLPLDPPVENAAVSSRFGVRADPFLGRSALHTGMDFAGTTGTRVMAAAAGTVVHAAVNGGYGNMVEIDHGGGVTTRYAHLSTIAVEAGDTVAAGTVLGHVGSTGRSTGPHLHYEVRREGQAIDPSRFLRAGRKIDALG